MGLKILCPWGFESLHRYQLMNDDVDPVKRKVLELLLHSLDNDQWLDRSEILARIYALLNAKSIIVNADL